MCGLVTVIGPAPSLSDAMIGAMRDRLAHRGPDGAGLVVKHLGAMSIAMAHRRLSIIDLTEAASQPMTSDDGRLTIVFNGEIYNYIELRAQLQAEGVSFRTSSDTEVLLACYRHWGAECLSRLNGMFAFVILDEGKGQVIVARDRFGEKPLFFSRVDEGGVAFASEIKALFAHPRIAARVNPKVVEKYTAGTYHEDSAETMFLDVYRVLPATAMILDSTGQVLRSWRYWIPDYGQVADPAPIEQKIEEFSALFERSLRLRLRADVPVGTSLSGGLDSSMIAGSLSRMRLQGTALTQNSFSARFDADPSLSEGEFIDLVVDHTGVNSHSVSPTPTGLMSESRALHWHQEEPFLSASIYLQWCVARCARANATTVLLDGQGADEILAGYQYYFRSHQLDLAEKFRWRDLFNETRLFDARLRSASEKYPDSARRFNHQVSLSAIRLVHALAFRAPRAHAGHYEIGVPLPQRGMRLKRQLAEAVQYNSLPALLRYADRNSMAFGLESRLPFLDYELVDWCIRQPEDVLIRDGWQKYVMRRAGEGLLPSQVQWRADKVGYAAPLDIWLRGEIKDWAHSMLFSGSLHELAGFDAAEVSRMWDMHQSGRANLSWALWRWISLGEWLSMHDEGVWSSGL
ncbi:asparagine synthase (glutamine-hydrolyzing) [Polaromonas aquatica]|uniref:asparagine synthase (glutamine-hydrolyzing) n=1 Tax=Polaromonas aquatica TaxID=332657 RepID=UPI003D64EA0E